MICIVSAIWDRWELTEIFLQSLKRYRQSYGIPAVVAGSEGQKSLGMCIKYGVDYVETSNKPVSSKFVKASQLAMTKHKPTNLLILGSDDFVDDRLIETYQQLTDHDIVGVTDCYYYNVCSREGMYWKGYTNFRQGETIGMARMISRSVYQRLNGRLWPSGMNSGLDYTMMQRLKKIRVEPKALKIEDVGMAVDFKWKGNITGFDCYRSNMTEVPDETFETIPEFKQILKLCG